MKTLRIMLFVCLFSVFTAYTTRAQSDNLIDSLQRVLANCGHDTLRLQVLNELAKGVSGTDTEACVRYSSELLQEALLQRNNYYIVLAYETQIVLAYNQYNIEKVREILQRLEPIALQEKYYNQLFFARRCLIDMQMLTQDYERCEKEGLQLLKDATEVGNESGILDAYQTLANLYRLTYRVDQAIEVLEKALPKAIAYGQGGSTEQNIYQTLISLYQSRNDFKNWIRTLDSCNAFLQKNPKRKDAAFALILYASYLTYYTQQENWEQAEKYRLLGEQKYALINSMLYKLHYDYACFAYFNQRELYDEALAKINSICEQIATISSGPDYYNSLVYKATILYKMNRYEEALPIFKQVINFNDSLQIETVNKQYEQLKKDFNADQLLFEQASLQQRVQLYTLGLLLIGLLVIGYFTTHLLRSRRFLQKAEQEMREMNRQMELANQAKDHFLSSIKSSICTPLNTVVEGSLRLAGNEQIEEPQRQALSADIRHKATELLKMINDILDLSRLEAGMMKFEESEVEITSQMLDAIGSSPVVREGVEIVPDFPMNILYMTRTDSNRLLQVFKSLFEQKDPVAKRIEVKIAESGSDWLDIDITGTWLASEEPGQEIIIRNEINRMLIEQFKGSYEISLEHPRVIHIRLPILEIIRS